MNQQPDAYYDAMPCPECGSRKLIQESRQRETLLVDEDGNEAEFKPRELTILALYCTECDEQIWEADE